MSYIKPLLFLMLSLFIVNCSMSKKEDPFLEESAKVHNEAIDLAEQLDNQLTQLSTDSSYQRDSLEVWRSELENWKNNLVEVPGNESHDLHEHAHHEHEKQATGLTSNQMLLVQREMKAQLESIQSRINASRE